MIRTAAQTITGALKELGIAAAGEPVDPEDMMYGLECFNDFIDALKASRILVWEARRDLFAITAAIASYLIGPGATWDTGAGTTRPEVIPMAGFVDSQGQETPMHPLTDREWADITTKSTTSTRPDQFWYQTGVPNGTVFPYPVPSENGQAALYLPHPLDEVAEDENGLATQIIVPPGYRRFFRTNLALEIASAFDIEPSEQLRKKANDSMRAVMKANAKSMILKMPVMLHRRAGFNILTGR